MTHAPYDPKLKKTAGSTIIDPKAGHLVEIPLSPIKGNGSIILEEKGLAEKTFRAMLDGASD